MTNIIDIFQACDFSQSTINYSTFQLFGKKGLLNLLFRRRSKNTSKLRVFVQGIHQWLVNSPHKGPLTRKIFPFDDVIVKPSLVHIMACCQLGTCWSIAKMYQTTTNNKCDTKNYVENSICKMATILSKPQYVYSVFHPGTSHFVMDRHHISLGMRLAPP